jgi:hypothetical protein
VHIAGAKTPVPYREESENTICMLPLKALHDKLVRAHNELQVVVVVEGLSDVLPKCVACSTGRDAPPISVIWIRPHKVADIILTS